MSDETPRLKLPELVDGQELDAMTINDALIGLDALTDICLKGQFVNTPPLSPADGDTYLLGAAPTGAWNGRAFKIACCLDGGWRFYTPFDGLRVFAGTTNATLIYLNGSWLDGAALLNGAEAAIASAATCDLGAAASLFVAVTGSTTITGFGAGANLVRYLRFAGALTLTHNATSLILPGGANIVTRAGDTALFASDASGNWRCHSYSRANGVPLLLTGTTTNDNAASGQSGEFLDSEIASGSAVTLTSGAVVNVTSLTLSAGDWEVWGAAVFHPGVTTTVSTLVAAIHTASATYPGAPNKGASGRLLFASGFAPNDDAVVGGLRRRYSLASSQTVYLVAAGYFGVSSLSAYGYLAARRVR